MKSFRANFGPATRRSSTSRPGNKRLPLAVCAAPPVVAIKIVPLARDANLARLEAALFLADEALPARRLADAAGLRDAGEARRLLDTLRDYYESDGSAFQIEELAGGFQLLTRPAYHPWLVRLQHTGHDPRLTPASLETLTVIAYRQPVTRADVEAVRGVGTTEVLRMLMEKGLVRVAGRHDSLGRPQLYGTTKKFLQAYGLNTLADLPQMER